MPKHETGNLPAVVSDYAVMKMDDKDFKEVYDTNMAGAGMTVFDLTQIKVPSGGGLAWSVPDPEKGEVPAASIEGVLVGLRPFRAYWKDAFGAGGGKQPPNCSSQDSKVGQGDFGPGSIGNPTGLCRNCPNAQFGTSVGQDGQPRRGKACRERIGLFLLTHDSLLPWVLSAPPTSLQQVRKYMAQQLTAYALPFYAVVTKFNLEKQQIGGYPVAVIVCRRAAVLQDAERERFKTLAETMKPFLNNVTLADEPEDFTAQGE